jgi:hypothetical protein
VWQRCPLVGQVEEVGGIRVPRHEAQGAPFSGTADEQARVRRTDGPGVEFR